MEFGPPQPTLTSSNQVPLDHHPTPPPSATIALIVFGLELTRSNRLRRRVSGPEVTQCMKSSVCRCFAVAIDYLRRAGLPLFSRNAMTSFICVPWDAIVLVDQVELD